MWIIIYTSLILNFIHKKKRKKMSHNTTLKVLSPIFKTERSSFITRIQFVYKSVRLSLNFHFTGETKIYAHLLTRS